MGADLTIMKTGAYFRDSYNSSNLLWQFNLDYWKWFQTLLNEEGNLAPENAKIILDNLKQKEFIFEQHLSLMTEENQKYFKDKYDKFKKFLNEAIENQSIIESSI